MPSFQIRNNHIVVPTGYTVVHDFVRIGDLSVSQRQDEWILVGFKAIGKKIEFWDFVIRLI